MLGKEYRRRAFRAAAGGEPVADNMQRLVDLDNAIFTTKHTSPGRLIDIIRNSLADDFRLTGDRLDRGPRAHDQAPLARRGSAVEIVGDPEVAGLGATAVVCTFDNAKPLEGTRHAWRCVYWRVAQEANR
jgi:hypothetical protein